MSVDFKEYSHKMEKTLQVLEENFDYYFVLYFIIKKKST